MVKEKTILALWDISMLCVGEGWNHPPFSAYEDENGRIFARGILDNKGPTLFVYTHYMP